ncbi:Abi family protein [Corynebacterium nasicanis]
MNFHYFLGYARNFRELHFEGKLTGAKLPSRVFRLIDVDAEVSTLLYSGIRNSEWLLRHFLVRHYCQKFEPHGSFLDFETYLDLGGEYSNGHLARGLMNDILEYSESYVVKQLQEAGWELGYDVPMRCTSANWELCRDLSDRLPFWAVADSFSLGRLVKFVQRCDNDEDSRTQLWRSVADDMGVPAKRFQSGAESLRSLRNLVSHQARLWMRPTTNTATKKGQFRKRIDRCHKKSMLVAFYSVASFQGDESKRLEFADGLEKLIKNEPDYEFGVGNFGSSTLLD